MKPKIFENETERRAIFEVKGFATTINVNQYLNRYSKEWETARVTWFGSISDDIESLKDFARVMTQASKLAEKWTKEHTPS